MARYYESSRLDNYSSSGPERQVTSEMVKQMKSLLSESEKPEWFGQGMDNDDETKEVFRFHRHDFSGISGSYDLDGQLVKVWRYGYDPRVRFRDDQYVLTRQRDIIASLSSGLEADYNRATARLLENLCVTILNDENWLADNLNTDGSKNDAIDTVLSSRAFRTDDYDDLANGYDCVVVTEKDRNDNRDLQAFGIDATLNTRYQSLCEKKFWFLDLLRQGEEFGHINYFHPSNFTGVKSDDEHNFAGLTNVPRFIISLSSNRVIEMAQREYTINRSADTAKVSDEIGRTIVFELYAQAYMLDKIIQVFIDSNPVAGADDSSPLRRSQEKNQLAAGLFSYCDHQKTTRSDE